MNKFAIAHIIFSGLLLSYVWNNNFSLNYKFLFLFYCSSFTLLLMMFENKLEERMNKNGEYKI